MNRKKADDSSEAKKPVGQRAKAKKPVDQRAKAKKPVDQRAKAKKPVGQRAKSKKPVDQKAIVQELPILQVVPAREKPYEVVNGKNGKFAAAHAEPIDSPAISLRMTTSMFETLEEIAGKKKAEWIRQAIAEKLERDTSALLSTEDCLI